MGNLCKKAIFSVLGAVLLCLPATALAIPLDPATPEIESQDSPANPEQNQPSIIESSHLSRDIVDPSKELLVSIGPDTTTLEPNALYEIFLDDVSLGTYTSDYNGQLFVQVKIPPTTPLGPHTLKVTNNLSTTLQKSISLL